MTDVTCRMTVKNRDQLRNPTLGNRVWAAFFRPELRSQLEFACVQAKPRLLLLVVVVVAVRRLMTSDGRVMSARGLLLLPLPLPRVACETVLSDQRGD